MRHSQELPSAGLKSQPPGYSYETTGYEQFQVIFVASGRLHFSVCDQDIAVDPGQLVALRAGSAFRLYTDPDSGYGGVFYVHRLPLPDAFHGPAAACPADRTAQQLAGLMQQEIAAPGPGSKEVLAGLGQALAWVAVRLIARSAASSARPDPARYWTDAVRQAIQANLYTHHGVRELLAGIPLSYRQLTRYFTQVARQSPKQYQLQIKLIEAQRLLSETALPVTTVAIELGFPSSQHFAARFKQFCHRTPSAHRRRTPPSTLPSF